MPDVAFRPGFSRADFDKLSVGQACKIVREAHRVRLAYDRGMAENTERNADRFQFAMRDLSEALDGTSDKYQPVRR